MWDFSIGGALGLMMRTLPYLLLRLAVEEFLVEEAHLLDEWKLDDWLALFQEGADYVVPSTDVPEGDPREAPEPTRCVA